MGWRIILAGAVALAAAGCRGDANRADVEPARDDSAIGVRPNANGDMRSGAEADARSHERSGVYEVASVEKDQVILRQRGTDGEVENQSGRELRMNTLEFQRLAGREAREGEAFHVETDSAGKATKLEPQSERMQGGSKSGPQESSGSGANHGSGTSSGNNDGIDSD